MRPRARHVKYANLCDKTVRRYRRAAKRVFLFRRQFELKFPHTLDEFDDLLCEFVNFRHLDDRPISHAKDAISAVKKLYPHCGRHLPISSAWMNNWKKCIHPVRATPATLELVQGMAGSALTKGEVILAFLYLLSFWRSLKTELSSIFPKAKVRGALVKQSVC